MKLLPFYWNLIADFTALHDRVQNILFLPWHTGKEPCYDITRDRVPSYCSNCWHYYRIFIPHTMLFIESMYYAIHSQ